MVVMEKAAFSFNTSYVKSTVFNDTYKAGVPVVLNWRASPWTCEVAQKNMSSYACVSRDSECVDTTQGKETGYRCNCSSGYQGNPYIIDGCQGSFPFPALYNLQHICFLFIKSLITCVHSLATPSFRLRKTA
jgi:hypothetical protein